MTRRPPSEDDLMLQEVTDKMGSFRMRNHEDGDTTPMAETGKNATRRPYDILKANGPPQNPVPFPKPVMDKGRRDTVLVWKDNQHQQCHDVLFRDDNRLTTAYWSIPQKEPIKTIMGHVQICVVLSRCSREQSDSEGDDDDDDDDDSENEISEDEEDVVFNYTNEYVAVKVNYCSLLASLRHKHAEDPMKEIAAMQSIGNDHPNVLGCREVLYDGVNINVVLPYCRDGDLFELLHKSQRLPQPGLSEERARFYIRQILLGLQHLSRKGICHRDLSPENIMMDSDGCIVIDLGMCLQIPYLDHNGLVTDASKGSKRLLMKPQGACGKLPYMAPEIYDNKVPFDGEAVDVWSCGAILFCMLTGNRSYQRAHRSDPQYYWMTRGLTDLFRDWDVSLSKEAVHLVKGMLTENPHQRLTLLEVLNHPWFH